MPECGEPRSSPPRNRVQGCEVLIAAKTQRFAVHSKFQHRLFGAFACCIKRLDFCPNLGVVFS